MDETGDSGWGRPRPGGSREVVFKLAQRRVKAVGDGGLQEAAETFDRIEFRAVGRQRQ